MSNQSAIDAFNIALHTDGRMKRPSQRELAEIERVQRNKFKKYHKPQVKTVCEPAPAPEFEPYVLTRSNKQQKHKFNYVREIPGQGVIRAGFRDREEANRFARIVNNLYKVKL
jgi:hypothetical protein